jgi:hypothetical protein
MSSRAGGQRRAQQAADQPTPASGLEFNRPSDIQQPPIAPGAATDGVDENYAITSRQFNDMFMEAMMVQKKAAALNEKNALDLLNQMDPENQPDPKESDKSIFDMSLGEIGLDSVKHWRNIRQAIVKRRFEDLFQKNNLFYLGFGTVLFAMFCWGIHSAFYD